MSIHAIQTLFESIGDVEADLQERLPVLTSFDGPQLESYLRIMALAACSDGRVQSEELELLEEQLRAWLIDTAHDDTERVILQQLNLQAHVADLMSLSTELRDDMSGLLAETAVSFEPGDQRESVFLHTLALLHLYGVEPGELQFAESLAEALELSSADLRRLAEGLEA